MDGSFADSLVVLRRNRVVIACTMAPLALVVLGVAYKIATTGDLIVLFAGAPLFLFALLIPLVAARGQHWFRRAAEDVVVGSTTVNVGKDLVVPRTAIRSARAITHPEGVDVDLDTRFPARKLAFRFGNLEDARPLLRALGYDAAQRCAVYRLPSPVMGSPWSGVLLILVALFAAPYPLTILAALFAPSLVPLAGCCGWLLVALAAFWPRQLVIGADGFAWSWFGLGGFVPYEDITNARTTASTVHFRRGSVTVSKLELALRSGKVVTLPVARGRHPDGTALAAQGILTWLKIAWDVGAHAEQDDPSFPVPTPTQDMARWLGEVKGTYGGGGPVYREAAGTRQWLWRAVQNPRTAPLRRGAAAAIVGATPQEGERERLAEVAQTASHPRMRQLLLAASRGNEAAMLRALRGLSPSPQAAMTART